jgi:haloalkane dehalogenase
MGIYMQDEIKYVQDEIMRHLEKLKGESSADSQAASVCEVKPGVLRTPDECFVDLPDFPFEPHYVEVNGLRIHYLDEGPRDADPILLMHGEPTWCFLYRKMIPGLVAAGHRCIAPDLIGFGKSDKLASRNDYSYKFHVDTMNEFVRAIELRNITLFCQDWGSLIGIRVLIDNRDRFTHLIVANGGLPTGDAPSDEYKTAVESFKTWLEFSQTTENFPVGQIANGHCASDLADDVIAAYDAPFPNDAYKEAAWLFPSLVPISEDDPESENNRKGWKVLMEWEGKVLTLFSNLCPYSKGGEMPFQKFMPGGKGQPHEIIQGGGHFVQEDKGELLAEKIVNWLGKS